MSRWVSTINFILSQSQDYFQRLFTVFLLIGTQYKISWKLIEIPKKLLKYKISPLELFSTHIK
jgi:hypothetical protein